jgi:DNA polymerase III epsilon subunit-like protein
MKTIYLDCETTGLDPVLGSIVEIGIVDDQGVAIVDSLVNPERRILQGAINVHHITNEMVQDAPTREQILPQIVEACKGKKVVIYNAPFDLSFLSEVEEVAKEICCCMLPFAEHYQEWSDYYNGWKWQKLGVAAEYVNHPIGDAHRAVDDARACRAVWRYLLESKKKTLWGTLYSFFR